jgi:hypothetical protein
LSSTSRRTTAQQTGPGSSKTVWTSDEVRATIKKYSVFIDDALKAGANVAATQNVGMTIRDNAVRIQTSAKAILDSVPYDDADSVSQGLVTSLQDEAKAIQDVAATIQTDAKAMQDAAPAIVTNAAHIQTGALRIQGSAETIKNSASPKVDATVIQQSAAAVQLTAKSIQRDSEALPGKPRTAADFLFMAIDSVDQGKVDEAGKHLIETSEAIASSVRALKRRDRYWFISTIYCVVPIVFAAAWLIVFSSILFFWPFSSSFHPTQSLGLPAWAGPIGGIGACVQILISVVADVKNDGYSTEYRRVWYTVLPLVGLVFGFIAYMVYEVGLLSLAQTASTSSSGSQVFLPALITFLAGYSTDWFMGKLDTLTSGTKSSSS